MSGTIFGLGLSQRVKSTGKPESGWKLHLYSPFTNTPVTAYKDTGLTAGQEHPWPISADASGMMPAFWLADGSYRVRGTSSTGASTFFDIPSVLALGASSGTGDGGGGSVDTAAIFQTGDTLWLDVSGTRSGWVRDNGRSIGSASSGASERANADCEALFEWLWNNKTDTECPVSTGRGASASADWAANKTITLPDKRNCAVFGLDDMGNSAAGGFAGISFALGNATTAGSKGGAATHALTEAELPALTKNITATTTLTNATGLDKTTANAGGASGGAISAPDANTLSHVTITASTTGTVSFGSGDAIDKMPPFVLATCYRKL